MGEWTMRRFGEWCRGKGSDTMRTLVSFERVEGKLIFRMSFYEGNSIVGTGEGGDLEQACEGAVQSYGKPDPVVVKRLKAGR